MSAYDYARPRATASRLLARFGLTGAIRRYAASGSPHDPTLTPTDYAATLFDDPDGWQGAIDGTLVRMTDKKVIVSVLAIQPTESDKIVIGGSEYEIVRVMPLSPSGVDVMWTIQARA